MTSSFWQQVEQHSNNPSPKSVSLEFRKLPRQDSSKELKFREFVNKLLRREVKKLRKNLLDFLGEHTILRLVTAKANRLGIKDRRNILVKMFTTRKGKRTKDRSALKMLSVLMDKEFERQRKKT